jgi:hypothetical protein
LQHLQHVGACDARAKKAVAINLADMSDLVADRRDLADGRLKPLLSIQCTAQTAASILPTGAQWSTVAVIKVQQRLGRADHD